MNRHSVARIFFVQLGLVVSALTYLHATTCAPASPAYVEPPVAILLALLLFSIIAFGPATILSDMEDELHGYCRERAVPEFTVIDLRRPLVQTFSYQPLSRGSEVLR
jgi:hypothetical protein